MQGIRPTTTLATPASIPSSLCQHPIREAGGCARAGWARLGAGSSVVEGATINCSQELNATTRFVGTHDGGEGPACAGRPCALDAVGAVSYTHLTLPTKA